jgi:hypothetical protein
MSPRGPASDPAGVDRRKNKLFVTRNSEYFTHDGVCLRVRDRRRDQWLERHEAIGHRLTGALHVPRSPDDSPVSFVPAPGDALVFEDGPHKVLTSALERVSRPPREVVARSMAARS